MAKLEGVFNANEVPEREEFTPVPPGAYTAMIVSSDLTNTKAGGQMIVLELDIQEGDHSGRKLFERLNIKNSNQKAVDIAYRTLGEIVKAVGKTTIKDTEELHNKRLVVNVVIDPPTPYEKDGVKHEGKPQNSIKRFLPYVAGASTTMTPTASASPEQPQAASVPPWKRNKG